MSVTINTKNDAPKLTKEEVEVWLNAYQAEVDVIDANTICIDALLDEFEHAIDLYSRVDALAGTDEEKRLAYDKARQDIIDAYTEALKR